MVYKKNQQEQLVNTQDRPEKNFDRVLIQEG